MSVEYPSHYNGVAGSRQYCDTPNPRLSIIPLKEISESPRVNENFTSVGYRLSYEASMGAGRGNLGSESRLMYK